MTSDRPPASVGRRIARTLTHVAIAFVLICASSLSLALVVRIDPAVVPDEPETLEIVVSRIHTLRFHVGIAAAVGTAWLLLARRWRLATVGMLVVGWAVAPVVWPANARAPDIENGASFNLGGTLADEDRVFAEIEASNADVLIVLEYSPAWQERLGARLRATHPHRVEKPRHDNFGIAVFSRVEWRQQERFVLGRVATPQYRFEVPVGPASIVLYAIHILPPARHRYVEHRRQFADLLGRLDDEAAPTVLAGDFNFVDHGPLAGALHARGFANSRALAGSGRGATWPVNDWLRHLPGIRIDHVYVGHGLTATDAWLGGHIESDHLPIATTVQWAAP